MLAVVGGTCYYYMTVFYCDAQVGVYGLTQSSFRSFYCYCIAGYRDGDAGGYCYGGFSYT